MKTKICSRCCVSFPEDNFYKDNGPKSGKDGRKAYCKKCAYNYRKKWSDENPEKVTASRRKRGWRVNYNLAPEQYEEMLQKQKGVCAICKKVCSAKRALAVDHNHTTGAIRGLLCLNCNRGLSAFLEDISLFEKAKDYLQYYARFNTTRFQSQAQAS